ncbi:MAG: hypothetical protein DRQ42_02220 [Gammaproteobacteria bacterium]|nr:MAG: hypothetical protein DRQ42_02220 [Gammaproteobacteria bacterium]
MAYIQRNEAGKIIAVFEAPQADNQEYLSLDSPELIEYLVKSSNSEDVLAALSISDITLIRVLDDLINTLIENKVILFTDLPIAAQEKLAGREKIRGHLNNLDNLLNDDDGIL